MRPREYWRECWRRRLSHMPTEELRRLVRLLTTSPPPGEIIEALLPWLQLLQHHGCAHFARQFDLDRGNFNRMKTEGLSKLAARTDVFNWLRDELLLLLQEATPDLFDLGNLPAVNSHTFHQNCVKSIRKALEGGDFEFFCALTYAQIAPPTGRVLASCKLAPSRECWESLFSWLVENLLTSRGQAKAGISLGLFLLGLLWPNPLNALTVVYDVCSETGHVAEYDHSLLIGFSYNALVQHLPRDFFTQAFQHSLSKFSGPDEFARGVASFELNRNSTASIILNRLYERLWNLSTERFSDRDCISLLTVEVMPLLVLPPREMEQIWAWLYELADFLQRQIEEGRKLFDSTPSSKKVYENVLCALDWIGEGVNQILS